MIKATTNVARSSQPECDEILVTDFQLLEARDLAIRLTRSVSNAKFNFACLRPESLNVFDLDREVRNCFVTIRQLADTLGQKLTDPVLTVIERAIAKYQLHSNLAHFGATETTWHGLAEELGRRFLTLTIWPEEPNVSLSWEREVADFVPPAPPWSECGLSRYYSAFWSRVRAFPRPPAEMVPGIRVECSCAIEGILRSAAVRALCPPVSRQLWLTVTEAAMLLAKDLNIDPHLARARVSWASRKEKFVTNGETRAKKRIEPNSFDAWRLRARDRDLDAEDEGPE